MCGRPRKQARYDDLLMITNPLQLPYLFDTPSCKEVDDLLEQTKDLVGLEQALAIRATCPPPTTTPLS